MKNLQFTSCRPNLYDFLSSVDFKDDVLKNISLFVHKKIKLKDVQCHFGLIFIVWANTYFVFQEDSHTGLERHKGKQTTFLIQVWKDMAVSIFIFG